MCPFATGPFRSAWRPEVFIHVVARVRMSFLFQGWLIFPWLYIPHFVYHSAADGRMGWFHLLAAVSTGVQVSTRIPVFTSFADRPRTGTAGPPGSSVRHLLRNRHSFPRWLYPFTFLLAVQKGSNFSTSSPALIYFFSFIGFLVGVKFSHFSSSNKQSLKKKTKRPREMHRGSPSA